MVGRIIEYCAHNRFTVFLVVAAAVLAGVWSLQNMPLALRSLCQTTKTIDVRSNRWLAHLRESISVCSG